MFSSRRAVDGVPDVFYCVAMPSETDSSVDPALRVAGRGAASNEAGRFERHATAFEDDGWAGATQERPLRTTVETEQARKVVSYNKSPDLPFDRSLNPYRGCEHGCVYCYARPSHAWLGLSPGLDFETRLIAKPNAAEALARELSRPSYRPRTIVIGANTDAYQPIEGSRGITRECLQVLRDFRHPVAVITKGALIERDLDLLREMAAMDLVRVGVSVTTLDRDLSRRMEPRAPAPRRRLAAIGALAQAGVPVRIMASPIIPALNDHEIEALLEAGRDAGATAASWVMLRLPLEVAPLFRDWLERAYPDRAARIMGHVREMHGGKDYSAQWGRRMRGSGKFADLVRQRFDKAAKRLGLAIRLPDLRTDLFRPPSGADSQMSLFG